MDHAIAMRRLIVMVAASVVSVSVRAASGISFETGNHLYNLLTSQVEAERTFSMGFITGIADAGAYSEVQGRSFCMPIGATEGQIRDIVKNWLEKYPEKRHLFAAGLVAQALQEAFPCSPK
jgi:hypothetical protein